MLNYYSLFSTQAPSCFRENSEFGFETDFLSERVSLRTRELIKQISKTKLFKFYGILTQNRTTTNIHIYHHSSLLCRNEIEILSNIPPHLFEFDNWEERYLETEEYQSLKESFSLMLKKGLIDLFFNEGDGFWSGKPNTLYIFLKFQRDLCLKRLSNKKRENNINLEPFLGMVNTVLYTKNYPQVITQNSVDSFSRDVDQLLIERYSENKLNESLALFGTTAKQWFKK